MRCPPPFMLVPDWFLLIAAVCIIAVAFSIATYHLTRSTGEWMIYRAEKSRLERRG
jgi:hypothetical protein